MKKSLNVTTLFIACIIMTICISPTSTCAKGRADIVRYNNESMRMYDKGDFKKTGQAALEALNLAQKTKGISLDEMATLLNSVARCYREQGNLIDAEIYQKKSYDAAEEALGPQNPELAMQISNLALIYAIGEKYEQAESLFKKALRMVDQTKLTQDNLVSSAKSRDVNLSYKSAILNNLGQMYQNINRLEDAEQVYVVGLQLAEKTYHSKDARLGRHYGTLADIYVRKHEYQKAIELYSKALELYLQRLGPDHHEVGWSYKNLAWAYFKMNNYKKADEYSLKALGIYELVYGNQDMRYKELLSIRASILNGKNDVKQAYEIIEKLVDDYYKSQEAFSIAYNAFDKGIETQTDTFELSFKALQMANNSKISQAANRLAQRYSVGTDELAILVRKDQDLETESEKLNKDLTYSISQNPSERNLTDENKIRRRLKAIEEDKVEIIHKLSDRFPSYLALSKPQSLSFIETENLLAADEALVAFNFGEENYAWIVTNTDHVWLKLPGNSNLLNEQVTRLRQSLTFSENGKAVDKPFNSALAFKIYQQTLGPIADKIAGKKRLSIIANGALTSIPLGLLVSKDPVGKSLKDTDWLIKSYAITVLPSIYSLKTMRSQAGVSTAAKPMIAFADPVFSKAAQAQANQQVAMRSMTSFYYGTQIDTRSLGEHLPQLPNTRDEVQTISRELGAESDDIKLGLQATETTVKQVKLDQYRIVYFATHGLVAGDLEKFSKAKAEPALVLTIPSHPTDQDDGLLQASEIAQLKLNADWAVLSACNTASSDGVGAEALSGLARAFIYAGARSLLVSNWDVSDDATKSLMTRLFEISSKNKSLSHGEALQQATLQLLNNAKTEEEAHPRYWAPFIVVGEPIRNRGV